MTNFKLEIKSRGLSETYLEWEVHATESNVNDIGECVHDIVQRVITPKNGTGEQITSCANGGQAHQAPPVHT